MRKTQPDSPMRNSVMLLGLFIWLTTVARSERQGDNELRKVNFTNNTNNNSSANRRSDLADAGSQDEGQDFGSGSRSTKFVAADRVQGTIRDTKQNMRPMTSSRQLSPNPNMCPSLSGNAGSVTHSVTLLRISPQFSASHSHAGPLTFSVDATITILTVEINSSVSCDAGIWDPTGTMINKRFKRGAQHTALVDHKKNVNVTLHFQQPRISNNRFNASNTENYITSTRNGLNQFKEAGILNNSNTSTNKPNRRTKRTVRLITLDDADGSDVWEIDPPNTGVWSIAIDGPEPAQIAVTAISSLDFNFEFLDIRTKASVMSQPVAYETAIVRLTVTSQPCVANVTTLNLLNDAGETILAVESSDVGLHPDSKAPTGKSSILFWLQMPEVPFFMSAAGYDVTGQRFQRLGSERVLPRMFALSFVNFKSDPLVPGTDYKFGVRLRNKGGNDVFKIVGTWENPEYFKVVIAPTTLKVEQNQMAHVSMLISVKPSINFVMKGALTVTAYRLSDNVTDTLTETLTGEPASFLQDYESPSCTTSTTGGCRPDLPCQAQKWTSSVLVSDSLTGVRSAVFLNPPRGSFNRVQFLYSMTNRTARAEYGFCCCDMGVTLLAYDYANNPSYCKLVAPILDPQITTSLQFSQAVTSNSLTSDRTLISTAITPATRHIPIDKQSSSSTSFVDNFSRWSQNSRTFVSSQNAANQTKLTTLTGNTGRTPDFQPSRGRTTSPVATAGQSLGRKTTRWISFRSVTTSNPIVSEMTSYIGSTNRSALMVEANPENQHTASGIESSTLRLAAIVCGSLAGVAGLAIGVICLVFRCMVKHQHDRSWRRRSNESDVTMGSSSETRSIGSYSADSLRMSRTDKFVENLNADSLRMSKTSRSIQKSTGIDSCRTAGQESANSDSIAAGSTVFKGQKSKTSSNEYDTYPREPRHFKKDRNEEGTSSRPEDVHYDANEKNGNNTPLRKEASESVTKVRLAVPKRDRVALINGNTPYFRREEAVSFTAARRVDQSTSEDVEDVIFRCVFVKKPNVDEDGVKGWSSDKGGGEVSKISYSPLLRSGGKTYSSMLQVQKQIEEMEQQSWNNSSAASHYPPTGTSSVVRRHSERNEIRATTPRLHLYEAGISCNDVPPGSPQFKGSHLHTPRQRAEMYNASSPSQGAETCKTLDEHQSQYDIPIRRQVPDITFSVQESEKECIQETASNKTGPYYGKDNRQSSRFPEASKVAHGHLRFGSTDPHASSNDPSRYLDVTMPTAGCSQNEGDSTCECCDLSVRSGAVDGSSYGNVTSKSISPRQYSANYNQKLNNPLKIFKISQTVPSYNSSNAFRTQAKLPRLDDNRRFKNDKRSDPYCGDKFVTPDTLPGHGENKLKSDPTSKLPGHLTAPENSQRNLDATNNSHPFPSCLPKFKDMCTPSPESSQASDRVHGRTCRPNTFVYGNSRASVTEDVVSIDTCSSNEINEEEEDTHRVTVSSTTTPSQSPSNSRSESPDPQYLQPGNGSRVVSDASQMALRHDIEHIRQKLLKFQRRIDHEIEDESRRSRGNSPCPSDNSQSESK